jgi:hypothetical protein
VTTEGSWVRGGEQGEGVKERKVRRGRRWRISEGMEMEKGEEGEGE